MRTIDAMQGTRPAAAVEIVKDRVFAVGGSVELDGRVSWASPSATGFMRINGYLIRGDQGALLVDTGAGMHEAEVVQQLLSILPEQSRLSVLLTRTEMDCPLNVPAIEDRFEVETVRYTGGLFIPRRVPSARVDRFAISSGEVVMLEAAPGIVLEIRTPRMRLLPTLWPYDPVSKTLFTSDAFGYLSTPERGTLPVVSGDTLPTAEEVRSQLLAKLEWLTETDTEPIADDIRATFVALDVEVIAPSHGCAIRGRELVQRHAELFESVVREVGR